MGALFDPPKAPPPPPPPPNPPTMASAGVEMAGANAKQRAAAAAGAMGFGDTVKTSPQGLKEQAGNTSKTLLGS